MRQLSLAPRRLAFFAVTLLAVVALTISGLLSGLVTRGAAEPQAIAMPEPSAPIADALPEVTAIAAEMRTRTTAQVRADRERSIRASRLARTAHMRTRIIDVARKQIGDRYVAGRTGPDAFDCSGLTRYVYKQATGHDLPRTSRGQYQRVKKIKRSQARPGDLVFFFERGAHHVGIYIGGGKMIDAPRVGEKVRVSPISGSWWGRSYTGMGRILPG